MTAILSILFQTKQTPRQMWAERFASAGPRRYTQSNHKRLASRPPLHAFVRPGPTVEVCCSKLETRFIRIFSSLFNSPDMMPFVNLPFLNDSEPISSKTLYKAVSIIVFSRVPDNQLSP
jgi:hypothetical protein